MRLVSYWGCVVCKLLRKVALHVLPLLFLVACTSSGPINVQVSAIADARMNQDEIGNSLSLVVRTYQLKSEKSFAALTFDFLASGRQENELLGSDLVALRELVVVPGGRVDIQDNLHQETRYVGAVAFMRHPDPHYWRVLVDARQVRKDGLTLKLSDCYLQVIKPDLLLLPGQPPQPSGICPSMPGGQARPMAHPRHGR